MWHEDILRIENAERFANYVLRILPEAVSKEATFEESLERRDRKDYFLCKVMRMIQMLVDRDLTVEALQVLVLLKALFKRSNTRIRYSYHEKEHAIIDVTIKMFVGESGFPEPEMDGSMLRTPELHWCSPLGERRDRFHWNFASAARTLRSSYLATDSNGSLEGNCDRNQDHYDCCFHDHSIDLVDWLQRKAWSEVRVKVLQTIGTILPAELMEHVLNMPLKPRKYLCIPVLERPS